MQAWHQRNLLEAHFPFNLFITDIMEYPPHWHEEIEVIYVLEDELKIGLSNEVFILKPRDIFLVGAGEVHYFLPQPKACKRIIIQFEVSILDSLSTAVREKKFIKALIRHSNREENLNEAFIHQALEKQILNILDECNTKQDGYKIALKARLYDLVVILLRHVPMEKYSAEQKNKHLNRLERLEQVFQFVENNFDRNITLEEISRIANFSVFHFTRFFKETTGMTFIEYLNNYRVTKASNFLLNTLDPVTDIVFRSGFNSIKTFNRVFKHIKGCSPSQFRKSNL